jgi:hypothetical protein
MARAGSSTELLDAKFVKKMVIAVTCMNKRSEFSRRFIHMKAF